MRTQLTILLSMIWMAPAAFSGEVLMVEEGSLRALDPTYVRSQRAYVVKLRLAGVEEAITFVTSSESELSRFLEAVREANEGKTRQERYIVSEECGVGRHGQCRTNFRFRDVPQRLALTIDHMHDVINWQNAD